MNNNFNIPKSNLKGRPIPTLKETTKNYLKFLKPFIQENKSEVENSEKKLEEFSKANGTILQERLVERIKNSPNWLYEYQLENKHLARRDPIPVENNYYLLYDFNFKDQIEAVAKIILCSVLLKNIIRDNKLQQITNKCSYQYNLLFHSTRSPHFIRDKLDLYDYKDNNYIVIIFNNVFWVLEATLDYDKICDQVSYITSMDLSEKSENYIGILTAGERNKWSDMKERFLRISHKNKEFLYYLDRSMLLFSLDEKSSTDLLLREINSNCWYGDGQNKYFDKLVQLIVLKDGFVAMNGQKDLIDQSVCIEFARLILDWTKNNEAYYMAKKTYDRSFDYFENFSYKPIKLNYDLDEDLKLAIKESYRILNNSQQDLFSEFMFFNEYGKTIFEKKGILPHAYIQLALLAAYYRTFLKVVPSRQFLCGRNFAYGITEWVRTTTKESANFSIAINEMKIPRDLKIKIGLDAFKQHKNNTIEVNNGKSIDTHFIGLNSVLKFDEKSAPFFQDEIYNKTSHFIIETYPITSEFVKLSATPPSNKDGISITYIIRKENIQFIGAAYHDMGRYFQSLIEVLKEMKDLFIQKEREFYIRPKF